MIHITYEKIYKFVDHFIIAADLDTLNVQDILLKSIMFALILQTRIIVIIFFVFFFYRFKGIFYMMLQDGVIPTLQNTSSLLKKHIIKR